LPPCYDLPPDLENEDEMTQWEPAPFVKLMGVKILQRSPECSESELFIREDLCNRRGVIHGGALMGWADTMGGMTASAALARDQRTATIESKTNFFAPIPKGDTAHAVCKPLHSGRTTIVLQTNITRGDGRLAAIVTQTQIVLPARARPE
jgi:uncharacterized protein (TIGR00369 family)